MMTDEQLKKTCDALLQASRMRLEAATLYRTTLEEAVPLVEGDTDMIKDARRAEGFCERFYNELQANLRGATVEQMAETFRIFSRGED